MKVSEALTGAVEDFLEVLPDITSHIEKTDNPHSVTKEQVGLENVLNERQITENDLQDHADGTIYRHPAEAIDYSEDFNLKEKIEDLIITGGGGTLYHDELLNRDSADAHPMSAISGLEGAISDIEGRFDEVIVFEGTTTDDTLAELTSSQTSDYINASGRLTVPVGRAVVLDITAVSAQTSGGAITSLKGCCIITLDAALARVNTMVASSFGEADTVNMYGEQYPTYLSFNIYDQKSFMTKVTGIADTTLSWRVEMRIKKVFDVSGQI